MAPRVVAGALSLWLAVAGAPAAGDDARAIEENIERLRQGIEADLADEDALLQRLDAADRQIAGLETGLRNLRTEQSRLAEQVAARADRVAEFERALPALQDRLWKLAEAHRRLSRRGRAAVLLSLEDPTRLQRTARYLELVSGHLAVELADVQARLARGRENREALARERRELETSAMELETRIAALESIRDSRTADLDRLRTRVGEQRRLVKDLERRLAALDTLVVGIAAAPGPTPASAPTTGREPISARRGRLALPADGRTSHRFDEKDPLSGVPSKGIFIETGGGADVRSISAGQVVYSDWFRGFGLLLVVDHGEGFMSLYGNNSELLVPAGATVEEGMPIARAGSSGGRGRSGVYFEFRHQGAAVDPLAWCRPGSG